MAELNARYAAHTISAAQFQTSIASYRSSADTIRKQLASMQSEGANLRADAGTYRNADLGRQASRIDGARQREAAALQSIEASLSAVPVT